MFLTIVHTPIGGVHTLAAVLALIFGTFVLAAEKGTQNHVRAGYAYCASMIVMLVTAFFIFQLFGSFGLFHWLAVVSTVTLIGGMVPILVQGRTRLAINFHIGFMYWSVIGLYCAFAAETLVRLQLVPFFWMVGVASGLVGGIGSLFYRRYLKSWEQRFVPPKDPPVETA